jgi:hypothetical protein
MSTGKTRPPSQLQPRKRKPPLTKLERKRRIQEKRNATRRATCERAARERSARENAANACKYPHSKGRALNAAVAALIGTSRVKRVDPVPVALSSSSSSSSSSSDQQRRFSYLADGYTEPWSPESPSPCSPLSGGAETPRFFSFSFADPVAPHSPEAAPVPLSPQWLPSTSVSLPSSQPRASSMTLPPAAGLVRLPTSPPPPTPTPPLSQSLAVVYPEMLLPTRIPRLFPESLVVPADICTNIAWRREYLRWMCARDFLERLYGSEHPASDPAVQELAAHHQGAQAAARLALWKIARMHTLRRVQQL